MTNQFSHFKTPSGAIIKQTSGTISVYELADQSNENGWFEYWQPGNEKSIRQVLIIDHKILGHCFVDPNNVEHFWVENPGSLSSRAACSTKEEFERYLKLQAFQ